VKLRISAVRVLQADDTSGARHSESVPKLLRAQTLQEEPGSCRVHPELLPQLQGAGEGQAEPGGHSHRVGSQVSRFDVGPC